MSESNDKLAVIEPSVVEKVRALLKQRVPQFVDGKPYTATFSIYKQVSNCFLRIGEQWACITHIPDRIMNFNYLGISEDKDNYPDGFVHCNCHLLADALCGLGFLTSEERDEFKMWSHRVSALRSLVQAQREMKRLENELLKKS